MTIESKSMEQDHELSFFTALRDVTLSIPKLISGVVSFVFIAYLVGYQYAKGYFGVFGAEWLVSELSIFKLLAYSAIPLMSLLVIFWFGVLLASDPREENVIRRVIIFTFSKGWLILLPLLVLEVIVNQQILNQPVPVISYINALCWSYFVVMALIALILAKKESRLMWDMGSAVLTYVVLVIGLFSVPLFKGQSDAIHVMDSKNAGLPVITLKMFSTENIHLRLLLNSGDRFYAVNMKMASKVPEIVILDRSEIKSISKSN